MKLIDLVSKIPIWESWCESYNKFVPSFIKEARTKIKWEDWDQEVFYEFFEQARDQCVSSLQQGYYTNDEKLKIKAIWTEIGPLLKKIADSQDRLQIDIYTELSGLIRKQTTQNRVASANRLIASLQPKLLCTIVNNSKLNELIYFLNEEVENCNIKTQVTWFEKSNAVLNFFTSELNKPAEEIMTLPWQVYAHFKNLQNANSNDMSDSYLNIDEVKALLNFKKQIILQGPPGTGKTRMAIQLAKALTGINDEADLISSEQVQLVQFHPSYSYEDFVEGLKPHAANNSVVYRTEDGIFKTFCKRALVSTLSNNESTSHENSFDYIFSQYITELRIKPKHTLLSKNNVELIVDSISDTSITVKYKYSNSEKKAPGTRPFIVSKDKLRIVTEENIDPAKVKNLRKEIMPLVGHIAGALFAVYTHFYEFMQSLTIDVDDLQTEDYDFQSALDEFKELNAKGEANFDKKFILIIDEMNRANLSTVLGELISLVEDGKRLGAAEELALELPYSKERFGIPKNVYIIGTMNTADRSVSQIDYAIRRRFAFVDVLPQDLAHDGSIQFDSNLFLAVSRLFQDENGKESIFLSPEFKAKEVQLGHSYFIKKDGGMKMRLDYEIKPILFEYVRDGILKETAHPTIESLTCSE